MATLDYLSNQQLADSAGAPYAAAKVYYWADVGVSTPLDTYSDAGLSSARTHPVVADSAGVVPVVYLQAKRYWRTVTTSADVSLSQFNAGPIDPGKTRIYSASAPSPTYPGLEWVDTDDNILYERNSDDTAWISRGDVDSQSARDQGVNAQTGTSYTIDTEDRGGLVTLSNSSSVAVTLPQANSSTFAAGWFVDVQNKGAGVVTITPTTSTIGGGTAYVLDQYEICRINSDGTNYQVRGTGKVTGALDQNVISKWPRGYLSGFTLSRASATTFGVAVGACRNEDSGTPYDMELTSAFTKSLSAWAVGTGNGGLDTGAVGNDTWYHVHLIRKDSDASVDVLYSTSVAAPTMPSGYTARRRIGSFLTDGSAEIVDFDNVGDEFLWDSAVVDINAQNPGTDAVTATLTVPTGVVVWAIVSVGVHVGSGSPTANVSSLAISDQAAQAGSTASLSGFSAAGGETTVAGWDFAGYGGPIRTNTSGQIRYRLSASTTNDRMGIITRGWIDARGKG